MVHHRQKGTREISRTNGGWNSQVVTRQGGEVGLTKVPFLSSDLSSRLFSLFDSERLADNLFDCFSGFNDSCFFKLSSDRTDSENLERTG